MISPNGPPRVTRGAISHAPLEGYSLNRKNPRNDPLTVKKVYRNWCMDGIIYSRGDRGDEESLRAERDLLFDCYFYDGDPRGDGFHDAVTDAMIEHFTQAAQHLGCLLDEDYARRVYERTTKDDTLRNFLITFIVFRLPLDAMEKLLPSVEPDHSLKRFPHRNGALEEFRKDLDEAATRPLSDEEKGDVVRVHPTIASEMGLGLGSVGNIRFRRGRVQEYPWVTDPCLFHEHGKEYCRVGLLQRHAD